MADVTSRAEKRRGHLVDESVGRGIRNELLSELGRDETRRRWMAGEKRDDGIARMDPIRPTCPAFFDALAENGLNAIIVGELVEEEASFIRERAEHLWHPSSTHSLFDSFFDAHGLRADDGPPGERASHFDDIFLFVAAIHAQGVELHELSRIVLVDAATP